VEADYRQSKLSWAKERKLWMLPLTGFETDRKTQTQSSIQDHLRVRDSKWKSGSPSRGTEAERPTHAAKKQKEIALALLRSASGELVTY